jgi:hypothetical protein
MPPVTLGAAQLYVVPAGTRPLVTFAGVTVKAVPLQTTFVIKVTAGFGFTVTVTVKVLPEQLPDSGVTVYVAVAGALVMLVSVWLILTCGAACAPLPVIDASGLRTGAPQVYVVPPGTVPSVPFAGAAVNVPSLQMDVAMLLIVGFGLTVMVTVKVLPVQLPVIGVTVYVAVVGAFVMLVSV